MRWLIYRSHPTVIPWPATILDIARQCEKNNPRHKISGFLLYSNEFYLQLLEGPQESLDDLWEKLTSDNRHKVTWVTGREGAPEMPNLPMGYFDSTREQAVAKSSTLWRDRNLWDAELAWDLRDLLLEIAVEKYPSSFAR